MSSLNGLIQKAVTTRDKKDIEEVSEILRFIHGMTWSEECKYVANITGINPLDWEELLQEI